MTRDIHIREDLSKPENRINVTLFHLLMIPELESFFKNKLKLPLKSIIFPAPNLVSEDFNLAERPDYIIIYQRVKIGYIEIELGQEDTLQLNNYRNKTKNRIYSIVGKKNYHQGDLSLEEIYSFTKELQQKYCGTQQEKSLLLFNSLIHEYIIQGKFNNYNKRRSLSETMNNSEIIKYIRSYFPDEKIIDDGKPQPSKLLLNTVSESGFSVRIYCKDASNNSFSLMHRKRGSKIIYFPSFNKLMSYFPDKKCEVQEYAELISSLGCTEIMSITKREQAQLPLSIVEANIEEFCKIILKIVR